MKLFKKNKITDPILRQRVARKHKERMVHVRYAIFMLAVVSILTGSFSFYKEYNYQLTFQPNEANAYEVKRSHKAEYIEMKDWVLNEVSKAGFNTVHIDKMIHCESSWNAKAIGDQGNSLGLWQIHRPSHPEVSDECRYDYKCATYWSIQKRIKDGSWSAWSCDKLVK